MSLGRPLRIAMVAPPYLPTPPRAYGGTELVVAELVDGLLERGHEVVLFGAPGSTGGYRNECPSVRVLEREVWPPEPRAEAAYCARVARLLERGGFDLVHAHCPFAAPALSGLGVPQVLTVHHDRTQAYSQLYPRQPEVHYAFISARQRDLEVPLRRTSVVHHGLSPERYPLGPGGEYAAFLGRFSACKGLHHAIDAAEDAGVPLRAAGRPHPPDLEYFALELKDRLNRPHVTPLGEADHAQKVELLRHACALLFPIEWEEPFGLVMVESMLCGTPVVAFAHGAAPEVVDDGLTGFLVQTPRELAGALRYLARRGFDRRACRARAVERFGADAMVERYLQVYARALRHRAPSEVATTHA